MDELNLITGHAIAAAVRIHSKLGPGLLEKVYERILARDLVRAGLHVERQKSVSFDFEGLWFENAFRVDLLIERAVIVELKSQPAITTANQKQLLTYLKLLDCRVGLILNFGAELLKDGIKRVVYRLQDMQRLREWGEALEYTRRTTCTPCASPCKPRVSASPTPTGQNTNVVEQRACLDPNAATIEAIEVHGLTAREARLDGEVQVSSFGDAERL
jgi:iron complex transport system substrate-binding protein